MPDIDRAALRELLGAATSLPWRAGDLREGPVHAGIGVDGEDECAWCNEGEPVWTGEQDGRLTHRHAVGADHIVNGPDGGEPVAGNYDWEEGGIVREQDTRLIVTAINALPALLDRLDELDAEVARLRTESARLTAEGKRAIAREAIVGHFLAERDEHLTAMKNCHPDRPHDYYRWSGHAEARRILTEGLAKVDEELDGGRD